MPTSAKVAEMISNVEGFDVSFLDDAGNIVEDVPLASYPHSRAASNTWTISQWRQERIEAEYPEYWMLAWWPDGEAVQGRTLLETLRSGNAGANNSQGR